MAAAASYGMSCQQCGDRIMAPEFSEYLCEGAIRHLWCCSKCKHQFETHVVSHVDTSLSPELLEQFLPSLVVM
jgi:hypothetical protein